VLLLILLLFLLHVELIASVLVGVIDLSSLLPVAGILGGHHSVVIALLLILEGPRLSDFHGLVLSSHSLVGVSIVHRVTDCLHKRVVYRLLLLGLSVLVLLGEVDCSVVGIVVLFIGLLFFFQPLSVPGASCQPLLQGLLLQDPIIHKVEVKAFSHEELSEHGYDGLVVGSFFELQLPSVVQKLLELLRLP